MSFVCALPLVASFFSACAAPQPQAVGYVEGEYVLLAPTEVAQVRVIDVRRGDRVEAGEAIAHLESRGAELAVEQAKAALAQAEAQLANLKQGKRPEEIAVLEAQVDMAKAEAANAQRKFDRTKDLVAKGASTQAEYDTASTALRTANAKVEQAKANLAVAKLPARTEEIAAASSQRDEAAVALEQARWELSQRTIETTRPGRVADVIRNPGDVAGPSAPVVSMLPDGAVKLKVYFPEAMFSRLAVGDVLAVRCDGCAPDLSARISYVSPDPEFTPPVIYSLETRQKLVYLVEAKPEGEAEALMPGQIVDVRVVNGEW